MLAQGYSVNLYMFDGGTSFGWMNGANSNGTDYQPDVTSYDYDAPVSEDGELTPKYFAFRRAIQQATGAKLPEPPKPTLRLAIPSFQFMRSTSLWDHLPAPIASKSPLTMEDIGQSYGYILYRTTVNGPLDGPLSIDRLHDYARIYLNGKFTATLDRRLHQSQTWLHIPKAGTRLDILVENSGRVNFGKAINGERAGIAGQILFNGRPLTGWENFSLPMQNTGALNYSRKPCAGPCFYRAELRIAEPADTFLDTRDFKKGEVWINGRALGRIWDIGPQKTLYLPGSWLKKGANEIVVFDVDGKPRAKMQGLDRPILDDLTDNSMDQ